MTTYVFKCSTCDEYTEVTGRRFGDNHVPDKCTHCGDDSHLTQSLNGNPFILKGGGWDKAGHIEGQ